MFVPIQKVLSEEGLDLQLQIRDEAVNWLVELGEHLDVTGQDEDNQSHYAKLHDAIRECIDLEKFAAIVAADPKLAEVLWPLV